MGEVSIGDGIIAEVPSKLQKRVNKVENRVHYPHEDFLKETPDTHPLVRIPRGYIWGRQKQGEYHTAQKGGVEARKEVLALKAFEEDPNFLEKAPIIACLVPVGPDASRIVVIDGHHRFKVSGRLKERSQQTGFLRPLYATVPVKIYSPEEMAELYNVSGMQTPDGSPYTADHLVERLAAEVAEVEKENEESLPLHKKPSLLYGITSVDQLVGQFARQPQ